MTNDRPNPRLTRRSAFAVARPLLASLFAVASQLPGSVRAQTGGSISGSVITGGGGSDGAQRPLETPFQGRRLTYQSKLPFDVVLAKLYAQIGRRPVDLKKISDESPTWDDYKRKVAPYAGPAGFMLFDVLNYGEWIGKAGIDRRELRIVLGNPLIAISMIRRDLNAALFVPVEILLTDSPGRHACSVTYVVPSSMMVLDASDKELVTAAAELDAKLASLVGGVVAL